MRTAFHPYYDLAFDKMVNGYKGKLKYTILSQGNQINNIYIKTLGLSDRLCGYVYSLIVYFGCNTSYNPNLDTDSGQSEKAFEYLIIPVGNRYIIFADGYYTIHNLIKYLICKSINYCGTLMLKRKTNVSTELKTSKLKYREAK